jgi:ABC-2 type transport system ATP-binding protein
MLTTMIAPTAGSAQVAGFDIIGQPKKVRKAIGYVSQMLSADGALTGYENLLLFARIYGIPSGERKQRIFDSLEFMGLTTAAKVLVRNYSGGMIRRLEIAQSMLHRPPVLFLDEPTIGLDPVARHTVWQHLLDLRSRFGTTILMTTHDMEEADRLCEHIVIMHRGQAVAAGSPESLKMQVGPEADLHDVFVHFVGESVEDVGGYQESSRIRRTARRLG